MCLRQITRKLETPYKTTFYKVMFVNHNKRYSSIFYPEQREYCLGWVYDCGASFKLSSLESFKSSELHTYFVGFHGYSSFDDALIMFRYHISTHVTTRSFALLLCNGLVRTFGYEEGHRKVVVADKMKILKDLSYTS